MENIDCAVVGGGITGLAVARAMALRGLDVVVLEAEAQIGRHASSRNSEVIHAGIYYPPGSRKAALCVEGKLRLYEYCAARDIRHRRVGKLVVAASPDERDTLQHYWRNAEANGVRDLEWLSGADVAGVEPAVCCQAALWSPSTGIIDSHELLLALQADVECNGGLVVCNSRVDRVDRMAGRFLIGLEGAPDEAVSAAMLVNAAGAWAPAVTTMIRGIDPAAVPTPYFARGHYYTLKGKAPFSRLIYPVGNAAGLGIHLTLDLAGRARFGPDVQWIDGIDYEFDARRRSNFVAAIRRYYPGLDARRLEAGYTGIRPKIAGPGEPSADFEIQGPGRHGVRGLVNLYGIESPGLTASLAIGEYVSRCLLGDG